MTTKAEIVIVGRDETRSMFRSVSTGFANVNREAARLPVIGSAIAAAFGGGAIIRGIKSIIDEADAIGKASQKYGIAAEELSALAYAGKLSDVSFEVIGKSLKQVSVNMADTAKGTGEAKDAFKALGISVTDASGALKPSNAVMGEVADKFAGMEDGAGKTALAVRIFGKAGADMIPLLNAGSRGIAEMKEEAEKLGIIIGGDFTKKSEQFNDNLTRMSAALDAVKISLSEDFVNRFGKWLDLMAKSGTIRGTIGASWGATSGVEMAKRIEELKKELAEREAARIAPGSMSGGGLIGWLAGISDDGLRQKIVALEKLQEIEQKAAWSDGLPAADVAGKAAAPIIPGDTKNTKKQTDYGPGGLSAKEVMDQLHAEDRALEALAKARRAMGDSVDRLSDAYARELEKVRESDLPAAQRELAESLRNVDERAASAREEIARYADAQEDQVAAQAAASAAMDELNAKTITQKDAVRALWEEQQRLNGSWEYGASRALDKYKESAADVAGQTESAFLRAYGSIEDAAVKAAMGQKVSWRDMANSMIADIIRVQARAAIADTASQGSSWLKLALAYISGSGSTAADGYLGTTGTSAVGSGSALTSANYGIAHSGGIVGSLSASKEVSPRVFHGAPRYHGGGLVDGEVPIIAKRGEGVFTPEQMKALGPAGGNVMEIKVSVDARGTKTQGDSAAGNDLGRKIGSVVRALLIEEQRPGGLLAAR